MTASDVMTPHPVTVSARATVAEAAELLRDLAIRHLPVVQDGALVGILSDRDLRAVDPRGLLDVENADAVRARFSAPVIGLMSADVIAVHPETELSEVVSLMIETRVGAMPVIDPATREVVGIVSYIDVLRAVRRLLEEGEADS